MSFTLGSSKREPRTRISTSRATSLSLSRAIFCFRFWHEFKVAEDDVEWLAFEDVTTSRPCLPAAPRTKFAW